MMFWQEVDSILSQQAVRKFSSYLKVIEAWDSFVQDCESGYEMNLYEYDNDLSIRGLIQKILSESALKKYPLYFDFKTQIDVIDARLKAMFSTKNFRIEKKTWWEQGVLENAGDAYKVDISSRYPYWS